MDKGEEKRIRAEWKVLEGPFRGDFFSLSLFLIVETLTESEQNEIPTYLFQLLGRREK